MSDFSIKQWIAALADRLTGEAALTLIHRAEKLSEILSALEGRLGGAEVIPIRPRANAPAKRIIVRARKGSRAPLRLLSGLDLHDGGAGKYSAQAEQVLREGLPLRWS